MRYIHTCVLFDNKRNGVLIHTTAQVNLAPSLKVKETITKSYMLSDSAYNKCPQKIQSVETEKIVLEWHEVERIVKGQEFLFESDKNVLNLLFNSVNMPKTTELNIFSVWTVWCVNYISIIQLQKYYINFNDHLNILFLWGKQKQMQSMKRLSKDTSYKLKCHYKWNDLGKVGKYFKK